MTIGEGNRGTEFEEEADHLEDVVNLIDEEIKQTQDINPGQAAHQETNDKIQKLLNDDIDKLNESRARPYFGRVDFHKSADNETDQHYIGKHHTSGPVYSWVAPVARLFYQPGANCYFAPIGQVEGRVELKRQFKIANSQLLDFSDILAPQKQSNAGDDLFLTKALAAPSEGELREIVETIQPEQYEQIAAVEKPVMIVQGAAGSGKSLIGLHRVAYLLSPFSNLNEANRPQSRRVIILGPSPAFLKYVANLLPSLEQRNIRQTTVRDWLISTFSKTPRLEKNDMLTRFLNNRSLPSKQENDAERFKGSREMGNILERQISNLRKKFGAGAVEISLLRQQQTGTSLTVQRDQILKLVDSAGPGPLNRVRDQIVEGVLQSYWRQTAPSSDSNSLRRFREEFLEKVDKQISSFWPSVKFDQEYRNVLGLLVDLVQEDRATLSSESAKILADSRGGFINTDLAPLLYLDYLLNGPTGETFEHIVVDEAQDISPLELKILTLYSSNKSFTILGDIRQRTVPYRGIDNWTQLSVLFDRSDVSRYESRLSYRSTWEITKFSNRILRHISGSTEPPKPFERHGERPKFFESKKFTEMTQGIADRIKQLRNEKPTMTIGVLAKWTGEARQICDYLVKAGIADVQLLSPEGYLTSTVTVCPILLSKGLEFDAVLVAGVHAKNFTDNDFDNRLLYMACTRAKHNLSLHWFGHLSPTLKIIHVH